MAVMSKTSLYPPELEDRFKQPEGWRWHAFNTPDGRRIRFGTVSPKNNVPDAVVVVLQGLNEFSEKYYELASDLVANNMSFWMMDWYGQGKSGRTHKNKYKRHTNTIKQDVKDLHYFITEYITHSAVHPDVGRIPLVMLAHSMGGNIGLHYLNKHPDSFACAAFSAPMCGIYALKILPFKLSLLLTSFFRRLAGKSYVFGGKDWHPEIETLMMKEQLSSDPIRREIESMWLNHDEELRIGNVTFGWLHEANMSCNSLWCKADMKGIKTPCLFALAEKDKLVNNNITRDIIKRMPNATTIEIEGAKHEILFERDQIRNKFLTAFSELLTASDIKDKVVPF